jgi:non-ribosomal peptide synthase protein (TIGR01720 family)
VSLGDGEPALPLAHGIEINAITYDAPEGAQFSATWSWAPALVAEEAVRDMARLWFQTLEALVHHATQPGAGGRSPSDAPLIGLSQADIERLERKYAN